MTRLLVTVVAVLSLIAIAVAFFLIAPAFSSPERIEYGSALRSVEPLLAHVPADAVDVALIPQTAAVYRALRTHPVTSASIRELAERQGLPGPWAIGRGPLVIWRDEDGETGAIARIDPLRRFLFRLIRTRATVANDLVIIGRTGVGFAPRPIAPGERAHLFLLRNDRLMVSAVTIADSIRVHTMMGRQTGPSRFLSGPAALPQSAIVAASFASVPELVSRIEETLPVAISRLLDRGGTMALYQLHDERLLPRPRGVIVVPVDDGRFPEMRRRLERLSPELPFGIVDQSRRQISGHTVVRRESIGFTLEYTRRGEELLVAFDKSSIEKFLADRQQVFETGDGSVEWLVRLDPRQLAPALERIRSHAGVRVLIPELGRHVEQWSDIFEWIDHSSELLAVKRRRGDTATVDITIAPPK